MNYLVPGTKEKQIAVPLAKVEISKV